MGTLGSLGETNASEAGKGKVPVSSVAGGDIAGSVYHGVALCQREHKIHPPKINIKHENDGLEFGRSFSFSRGVFSGSLLTFRGVL